MFTAFTAISDDVIVAIDVYNASKWRPIKDLASARLELTLNERIAKEIRFEPETTGFVHWFVYLILLFHVTGL